MRRLRITTLTPESNGMRDGNAEKNQALRAFGREMQQREDALVEAYKKEHPIPSRGIIDTPELRHLREEKRLRFIEICEQYRK